MYKNNNLISDFQNTFGKKLSTSILYLCNSLPIYLCNTVSTICNYICKSRSDNKKCSYSLLDMIYRMSTWKVLP